MPPSSAASFFTRKKIIVPAGILLALGIGVFLITRSEPARVTSEYLEVCSSTTPAITAGADVQYLVFQLFTDISTRELRENFPPPNMDVESYVEEIVQAVGTTGCNNKKLGFVVGPLAFDHTDEATRTRIRDSFAIALKYDVAVGFHIDDSMFWGRMSELNTSENIEWLDFNKTPNTGRRVDWSANPTQIKPQLCINSPAVESEIKKRATLIGREVAEGIATLKAAGKPELFAGVIAGWETQIGKDFETEQSLGYCALANNGYSAANSPSELDQARVDITRDHINLWTAQIANAGVPENKIFSHIAVMPQITDEEADRNRTYLQKVNFTPSSVAFGPTHSAGFSTYPGTDYMAQIKAERAKNGNPSWISGEGTALDPALAELGDEGEPMEPYLAQLYNEGAALVNVFGWGIGPKSNAFRRAAENESAIVAYQKFLSGTPLSTEVSASSKVSLPNKIKQIQEILPVWIPKHKDRQPELEALMGKLDGYLKKGKLKEANKIVDEILSIVRE